MGWDPNGSEGTTLGMFHFLKHIFFFLKKAFKIKKKKKFIDFGLHRVFIAACGLSLAVSSRSCALVEVHGLLIGVASHVEGHRL